MVSSSSPGVAFLAVRQGRRHSRQMNSIVSYCGALLRRFSSWSFEIIKGFGYVLPKGSRRVLHPFWTCAGLVKTPAYSVHASLVTARQIEGANGKFPPRQRAPFIAVKGCNCRALSVTIVANLYGPSGFEFRNSITFSGIGVYGPNSRAQRITAANFFRCIASDS